MFRLEKFVVWVLSLSNNIARKRSSFKIYNFPSFTANCKTKSLIGAWISVSFSVFMTEKIIREMKLLIFYYTDFIGQGIARNQDMCMSSWTHSKRLILNEHASKYAFLFPGPEFTYIDQFYILRGLSKVWKIITYI